MKPLNFIPFIFVFSSQIAFPQTCRGSDRSEFTYRVTLPQLDRATEMWLPLLGGFLPTGNGCRWTSARLRKSALADSYFGHNPANRFEMSKGRDLVVDLASRQGRSISSSIRCSKSTPRR